LRLEQKQRLLLHLDVSSSNTHISFRIFLNSWLFFSTLAAKYQTRRNMRSSDRALIAAFKEFCTMIDRINLPKTIVDRANNKFKLVHDGNNLKGCLKLEPCQSFGLFVYCVSSRRCTAFIKRINLSRKQGQ
jgi:hypothetical protein